MIIEATIWGETKKAWQLMARRNFPASSEAIWLPKSQVELSDFNREAAQGPEGLPRATVELPEWLYRQSVEPFDNNEGWQIT